jgi:hypothetical protein
MRATEIIQRYVDVWNGRDADALLAVFTKDGTYSDPSYFDCWINYGNYSNIVFQLRFQKEYSVACESLSRPNNLRLMSEVLSEIAGMQTEPRYSW